VKIPSAKHIEKVNIMKLPTFDLTDKKNIVKNMIALKKASIDCYLANANDYREISTEGIGLIEEAGDSGFSMYQQQAGSLEEHARTQMQLIEKLGFLEEKLKMYDSPQPGALVIVKDLTEDGIDVYFLGPSNIGTITSFYYGKSKITPLAVDSPIGEMILKAKVGETVKHNRVSYKILGVY
jgi:hypothetical protein